MYNYSNSYPCGFGPRVEEPPSSSPSSSEVGYDYQEWQQQQRQGQQWAQQWSQPQWDHQQNCGWGQWDYSGAPYRSTQCPFYATMGQPMVYYATINTIQRQRDNKTRKSNYFVKAFRWYTQDHVPVGSAGPAGPAEPNVPDGPVATDRPRSRHKELSVAGFASWLDNKYDEYLKENQPEQDLKATQTSVIQPETVINPCCPCEPKRKQNISTQMNSACKQGGDTTSGEEYIQSMEYILAPKDMSRPLSDGIQTPPAPCCSEGPPSKKFCIKSRSTTNVCENKECVTHIDTVTTQEGMNVNHQPKISTREKRSSIETKLNSAKVSCECSAISVQRSNVNSQNEASNVTWLESTWSDYCSISCRITPRDSQKTSKTSTKKNRGSASEKSSGTKCTARNSKESLRSTKFKDKSCQCMGEFLAEISTQFSYECCLYCQCPTCFRDGVWTCQNKTRRMSAPLTEQQTPNMSSKKPCCASEKQPATRKFTASCPNSNKSVELTPPATNTTSQQCSKGVFVVNNDVQTSDYAISLGENTFGRCYPLYMRIVCADKLCDDVKCGTMCK